MKTVQLLFTRNINALYTVKQIISIMFTLTALLQKKVKCGDAEKQINVFEDEGISVLNGRYGPYVTDGKKNAKIPKDKEPASLTLEECQTMLAEAPARGRGRRRTSKAS